MSWRLATEAEWAAAAAADPQGTFFQTPQWTHFARALMPEARTEAWMAEDAGGAVLLPFVTLPAGGGRFRSGESVWPGVYGGPLLVGDPALEAMPWDTLGSEYSAGAAVIESPRRPFDPGWSSRSPASTHVLALSEEASEIERGYRKGHRASVRRAAREGVTVHRAGSEADFEALHELYEETAERWSREPWLRYGPELFREIGHQASASDAVHVHLARFEGRPVAAAVVLHHRGHAAYWIGATSDEGRRTGAGVLVLHQAIVHARDAGMAEFDLLPSGGLDAVARFKSGFGATERPIAIHRREGSRAWRLLSGARRALGGGG